jgi:trk system potassium uptake protein TrkH
MKGLRHPVRLIPLLFLGAIAIGTFLLCLPIASADGRSTDPLMALFTATSAVAVTGLIVVDTATYWSFFGQIVILALFQIGGFGIMASATLLGLLAGRGVNLRARLATQVERSRLETSDARSVLLLILGITLLVEAIVAAILAVRLALFYDHSWPGAVWHGLFHAVSAFNNAGFSTYSNSVMGFQGDWIILTPIMVAVIITALGFPVMQDLRSHRLHWKRYALHSKITLAGTAILLVFGLATTLAMEWTNPATLGPMGAGQKMLNAMFHSVMPRTAGFNSLDVGAFHDETLMVNYGLMFIGGGSAGTAGGIKITTVAVLIAMVVSEAVRHEDASLFQRRLGSAVQRQALSVAVLAMLLIMTATTIIAATSAFPLHDIVFECISAFSTVGLSTGITADLDATGQLVIIALMFVGRVGTITVATALALGSSTRPYRYPEENPIVG